MCTLYNVKATLVPSKRAAPSPVGLLLPLAVRSLALAAGLGLTPGPHHKPETLRMLALTCQRSSQCPQCLHRPWGPGLCLSSPPPPALDRASNCPPAAPGWPSAGPRDVPTVPGWLCPLRPQCLTRPTLAFRILGRGSGSGAGVGVWPSLARGEWSAPPRPRPYLAPCTAS